ncbi:WD40 repeat domain-containing protein [Polyangium sp. y55x31]|uniref:WD40 repeat domain-containing protein n=1 Tax=Polyangium sp. y55x31 TaxID=3042688 RepID=UPI00248318D7|nr:WD40 repeat domain-containing protein [Polyangium sp. y55x31]MDI1479360.1 WD40 repeat domain-containing protein [Polyangium sp. y55x31]
MSRPTVTEICRIALPERSHDNAIVLPDLDAVVTRTGGSLRLHSASTKRPAPLLETNLARISLHAVSRLGHRVAWSDGERRVFTSTSQSTTPVELAQVPYHLNCLTISGDERIVAAGGSALTWEREQYEKELRFYEAGMPYDYGEYRPEVRPNPGLGPGHVRVWDPSSGRSTVLDGHRDTISRMSLNHDGSMLAASDDHAIRVWDVASTRCRVNTPQRSRFRPQAFLLASDGDYVMAGDVGEIWLYDTSSTRAERVLALDGSASSRIAFDGTGRLSAVGYERGAICIYDNLSGSELCSMGVGERPHHVALSTAGSRVAALVGDTFVIWQLEGTGA